MTIGIDALSVAKVGLSAANVGYKKRHSIQNFWTKIKVFLDKGNTQIAICGLPSVGKSVLSAQMHGRGRDLHYEEPGESTKTEIEAITIGEWTKVVRVLPGQIGFRGSEEKRSYDENPDLEGLIFVVDYGYNKPRDHASQSALIKNDNIKSIQDLRNLNLKNEIDTLKSELNLIKSNILKNKSPKWIAISVNKIDLFHSEINDALTYYHVNGSSLFSQTLKDFQNQIGTANISIHTIPTCASPCDFSWNDEVQATQLTKQQSDQVLRDFIKAIAHTSGSHA